MFLIVVCDPAGGDLASLYVPVTVVTENKNNQELKTLQLTRDIRDNYSMERIPLLSKINRGFPVASCYVT